MSSDELLNVPSIYHNRRRKKQLSQTGDRLVGLTGLGCSVVISLVFVFSVIILAFAYQEITRDLPGTEVLSTYFSATQAKPYEPACLYGRNGTQIILTLENPGVAGNRYLKVSQTGGAKEGVFSSGLISATVAILQPDFWDGSGFSTRGLQEGEHPTIAQRLVDDLILWDEPAGFRRNIRERLLAAQVTVQYGHVQVLEWYLNSAKFGDLIYGADVAARAYFGKSADQLSLSEGILLWFLSCSAQRKADRSLFYFLHAPIRLIPKYFQNYPNILPLEG